MAARVLNGHEISSAVKSALTREIEELRAQGIIPGLAAILVGENPASQIYVRKKVQTCRELGLHSEQINLASAISGRELLTRIAELNSRPEIDGILVQLPLPAHINPKEILFAVDPAKDVDGFHPVNIGNLVSGRPAMAPCTPAGIIEILERSEIPIRGSRTVVIGRSDTVGKPVAMMLLQRDATVTICHSRTRDLPEMAREADILIAAIGRPAFVTSAFIKSGATVVDVGINRLDQLEQVRTIFHDPSGPIEQLKARGSILVGDVQPEDVREKAGAYTPVPGGIGPLTVAMLMANTVRAARRRIQPQND